MALVFFGVLILAISLTYSLTSIFYLSRLQEIVPELFDEYEKKCRDIFVIGVAVVPILSIIYILIGLSE